MVNAHLEVRLRLDEIARRSAALPVITSELADLAIQLDRLRRLNGKTGRFGGSDFLNQSKVNKVAL